MNAKETDLVLFRADGTVLRRKTFGGANPNSCGMQKAVEVLTEGIGQCTEEYAVGE